jgi:hypothetical protein
MKSRLPFGEETAHFTRMSGKSVTARTSITPQCSSVASPTSSRPIAVRIALRDPSQPTTYRARTVEVSSGALTCCSVTVTGPSSGISTPVAWRP